MAHYAFLNENNIVTEVIPGVDETELIEGISPEEWYGNFRGQKCIRTSYNNNIRERFASPGCFYDEAKDIFLSAEPIITDFQSPWMGWFKQNNPSIMIDAAPRSANRWLGTVLNKAFPSAFMRWGYQYPHNPKTFEVSKDNFDVIATIIRNPIDSIASSIVFNGLNTNDDILKRIDILIEFLNKTELNRESIDIFSFEDVTNNTESIIEYVGIKLNITPINVDIEALRSSLEIEFLEGDIYYVVPSNNASQIEEAKEILLDNVFTSKFQEANIVYNTLLGYTWKL